MFYFMEDITPLFIYISSCEKYYRQNEHGTVHHISIHLFMEGNYEGLNFGFSTIGDSDLWYDFELHRIAQFKTSQIVFTSRPFTISFTGSFNLYLTEEEIIAEEEEIQASGDRILAGGGVTYFFGEDNEEEDDDEEEELSINDFRVFKSEQCVICLEEKPKVLFCLCGHICVCEKCIKIKRLTKCPVCKTENTILRIIE